VYGIFSRVNGTMKGEFVAIDKHTGKEKFTIPMNAYSWASPIDVYDTKGNCYIFFTDVYGTIYLIDGVTGRMIHKEKTPYIFESSPVAWNNRIVVGTRGRTILSFLIE
jgi:outer membrane protein assembly factor BamB